MLFKLCQISLLDSRMPKIELFSNATRHWYSKFILNIMYWFFLFVLFCYVKFSMSALMGIGTGFLGL